MFSGNQSLDELRKPDRKREQKHAKDSARRSGSTELTEVRNRISTPRLGYSLAASQSLVSRAEKATSSQGVCGFFRQSCRMKISSQPAINLDCCSTDGNRGRNEQGRQGPGSRPRILWSAPADPANAGGDGALASGGAVSFSSMVSSGRKVVG